jgi:hypothetical protein
MSSSADFVFACGCESDTPLSSARGTVRVSWFAGWLGTRHRARSVACCIVRLPRKASEINWLGKAPYVSNLGLRLRFLRETERSWREIGAKWLVRATRKRSRKRSTNGLADVLVPAPDAIVVRQRAVQVDADPARHQPPPLTSRPRPSHDSSRQLSSRS